MEYKITTGGHIQIIDSDQAIWIAPNQDVPEKYKSQIESDPLYSEYRTQENIDAYEQVIAQINPREEEQLEAWRRSASLSRRRFKIGEATYKHNGTPLVELIEALLAGLPEPDKTIAGIAYRETAQFDRLDPFIVQFSQALGMTDEEVDGFFQYCLDEGWNA